jgi:hypothetical protein
MATEGKGIRAAFAAMLLSTLTMGQTAFPDHVVQNENWSSGTHHIAVTQKIIAPGVSYAPVSISGTADAEFKSGTQVRLTDGFHAGGFSGNGRFHAWIDTGLGEEGDVIAIAPDPGTHLYDNFVHVNKWEKFEIGMILPQAYQDAIDSFFVHYYSNHVFNAATPGNVDAAHDLNPYADDSLQLVMALTSPSGAQKMKWGFYMREAKWNGPETLATAKLAANTASVLDSYHIHFRFAPDEVGVWQFSLSIKAPHTTTATNAVLPALLYTGYDFVCDPPLADNHGPLHVNTTNRRTLQFEDGTAFFGLGTNMAGPHHGSFGSQFDNEAGYSFYQRDFQVMQKTMEQLHGVGGNYMRLWLSQHIFTPEWVNLGVYDAYHISPTCADHIGGNFPYDSNCQYLCWALDSIIGAARANDLYIQLCIDPNYPGADYESFGWGSNPYVIQYLDMFPRPYDVKKYFFAGGDTTVLGSGVFYYWKRKYKYIMSRWGYSVNLAVIEPFNEIDQMLGYQEHNLTNSTLGGLCPETKVLWPVDPDLPGTVNQWLTDIMAYVRGPVDTAHPASSPLGEDKKLFLMSYTDRYQPNTAPTGFFLPFNNPKLDLVDVHHGLYWGDSEIRNSFDLDQNYHDYFHPSGIKKPFHNGEYNTYALKDVDGDPDNGQEYHSEMIFDNYDVSFHNEIWASTFFGNFAAGTSWQWNRVFWWPDGLDLPPDDFGPGGNQWQVGPFSNTLGGTNIVDIGVLGGYPVVNKAVYHNFKPLSDLLSNPDLYDFFGGAFSPYRAYDEAKKIECYYLMNSDQTVAVGWVHNLNAYWENHFYITHGVQNFLGCTSPGPPQYIILTDFQPSNAYHLNYFPTRMNMTEHPADETIASNGAGAVTLNLSDQFHGIANNYLDTLHSDYAFIMTLAYQHRSMTITNDADTLGSKWDFSLYPNPAGDLLNLVLTDNAPKDITIYDLTGKRVYYRSNVAVSSLDITTGGFGRGAYCIRVSDATSSKMKTLILR